jgi:hypothetical protein
MDSNQIRMIYQTLKILPQIELDMKVTGPMPSMGDEVKAENYLTSKYHTYKSRQQAADPR